MGCKRQIQKGKEEEKGIVQKNENVWDGEHIDGPLGKRKTAALQMWKPGVKNVDILSKGQGHSQRLKRPSRLTTYLPFLAVSQDLHLWRGLRESINTWTQEHHPVSKNSEALHRSGDSLNFKKN